MARFFTSAIQQLVRLKAEKAAYEHRTSKISMLNQQMATYGAATLPDAVKQNFISVRTQTQIQLQEAGFLAAPLRRQQGPFLRCRDP